MENTTTENVASSSISFPPALIAMMVGIVLIGVLVILFGSKPQREQGAALSKFWKKAFKLLSTNFLTSGRLGKITDSIAALSVYNRGEIQEIAVKYFLMSTAISLAVGIAGIVLFTDTVSIMICIIFAIVINSVMVDKQLNKVNYRIYKSLKEAISAVRQEYLRLGSVSEAIGEADIPPLLRIPFDEIYQILTSADGELLLLKFYESTPFRSIQTMASMSFNINNSGDEKDAYGQSNYVQALTMLTNDVNSEIERLLYMKQKFGVIEYLALAPIFCMNIIESYFGNTMPGTRLIYNGMIGYLCRIITLVLCAVCYTIVANINTPNSVKADDRSPWEISLLQNKRIRQFIYNIEPKNKKRRQLERKLSAALSKKGPEHITIERVAFSLAALVFSLLAMVTIVTMSQDYYMASTDQLSLVADESMDKYTKEEILNLDREYMAELDKGHGEIDDAVAQELIKSYMPGLSDLQIQDQQSRIKNKYNSLQVAYFHWYYLVICFIIASACWKIPDILLSLRRSLVATEAEDDFLQLQTLMAILMNMNIDTMDALWQMCQNSRIHKDQLMYCYHSYPSNPELELARLRSKTRIPEFKRFIDKLQLTISELSLSEAYSDLIIERDHMLRIRDATMRATINKKRKICGPIAMAPFIACVVGELLIPIGYLGVTEFMKALGSMGQ